MGDRVGRRRNATAVSVALRNSVVFLALAVGGMVILYLRGILGAAWWSPPSS